jgi:hypothetical protein
MGGKTVVSATQLLAPWLSVPREVPRKVSRKVPTESNNAERPTCCVSNVNGAGFWCPRKQVSR